jgi:stage IV sporulation protein B
VTELINVTTAEGSFSPALKAGIQKGDIIAAVNGERVNDIVKLNEIIENAQEPVIFTVIRDVQSLALAVEPEFDLAQNAKKIGLMLKNNIAGIGTLTFVREDGSYGALGHQISDSFGHGDIYEKGLLYFCSINGYNRPSGEKAGELRGSIDLEHPAIGTIDRNKFNGIYGKYNDSSSYSENAKIPLGSRTEVTPGKAYIRTTIDGGAPKNYEISIIKAVKQDSPAEKGMVIRVTDKELLEKTGGILQGMSGSPIIQNGKLVGAVTHVFTNDPTTGYGIYSDFMTLS